MGDGDSTPVGGDETARIRELGIEPGGLPTGRHNALTDVDGVTVGQVSLNRGSAENPPAIRTGVTVVRPADRDVFDAPVTGATHVLNGYGKPTGFPQVAELGGIETPIGLTNTLNVWRVADAIVTHTLERHPEAKSVNPIAVECNDGTLSDIRGRHVTDGHVRRALDEADAGAVAEGCVGAGMGTTGYGWKAGIGTASRVVGDGTVGALVLTNTGKPEDLRIDGLPVGDRIRPAEVTAPPGGSIVMLVGTDATLTHRQGRRLAKRAPLGLARTGGIAHHGSGDFAIAFANGTGDPPADSELTPLFRGAIEATEEAIYNSLTTATTTSGVDGNTVPALPLDVVRRLRADR
jgi:D-aminopeptidase